MRIASTGLRRVWSQMGEGIAALTVVLATAGMVWASGGEGAEGHHGPNMVEFGWRILNFVVLAIVLYKLLGGKIRDFFAGRREGIKESLYGAAAAKAEADKKFKEYSERLEKATEEIASISDMIKVQGQSEKEKLIESARISAVKMKEDTKTRMEQDLKAARNALRTEAAELSVQMAENALTKMIKEEDHDAMVKDFLDRMVQKN